MKFFDWKEYKRIFFFKEIPSFSKSKENTESDFLNFYLYYQYHYIISSYFHFVNEKELKQNTSNIKFIVNDKNLKIYSMTIKDVSIPILIKYILNELEDYQYKNEYYISIYGINELRSIIPNFAYCFYQIPENKQVQTIFEYIDGMTLYDYFDEKKKLTQFHLEVEGQKFLSIIFQIVCSLEIAQQTLHFTHFDLHEKNIVLRKTNKKELVYTIFGKNFQVLLYGMIATFIDFEYSCIRKKDYILSKISPSIFKLGYYSTFIPGSDLLRLFLNMKYSTMKYSKDTTNFLYYVHQFIDYVFIKFFNFKESELDTKKVLYYHSQYFFNMAFTNRVYKNPYSFLLFLQRNKTNIENIFNIQNSIWKNVSLPYKKIYNCKDIQQYISINKCMEPRIENIFSYIKNIDCSTEIKSCYDLLEITLNTLYKTHIPNIVTSDLNTLIKFFNQYKVIKESYEFYLKKHISSTKKNIMFENENYCNDVTTFYRILCSIEYMILLKQKYPQDEHVYNELDVKKLLYL
jgi:hypothetical protein